MARKRQTASTTSKPPVEKTGTAPAINEVLNGSGTLPAQIEISEDFKIELGEVVSMAHATSGLSVDDWNALSDEARDGLLLAEIERVTADLAPASSGTAALKAVSSGLEAVLKAPAKQDAAAGQSQAPEINRIFVALSRVKRNGTRYSIGDEITVDRANFDALKSDGVFKCQFEDGTPVTA